jgi:hypothetical protein
MLKRMFLLSAAMLACLAISTTTQAGSVVATTGTLALSGPSTPPTLTTMDITYQLGAGSPMITSGPTVTFSGGLTGWSFTPTGPTAGGTYEIALTGAAASSGGFTISFTESNGPALYAGSTFALGTISGTVTSNGSGSNTVVTIAGVPEPSSIALLGIGLSSFIAFRRRFAKKLPVA